MNIYQITIDDLDNPLLGLQAVSLVDFPAVEVDFLKFKDEEPKAIAMSADEERHVITGVALLADTPIYRRDLDNGKPCYIVFTKDTIEALVTKYARDNKTNLITLQHEGDTLSEDACTMFESYLVDHKRGICPKEFEDCPDGSWIVSYKVNDPDLWAQIKNGDSLKGFSVECVSSIAPAKLKNESDEETFADWVESILADDKEEEKKRLERNGDIRGAMEQFGNKQLSLKIGDDVRDAQIYEFGKLNGVDVAQVYFPKDNVWQTLPVKELRNFEITTKNAVKFDTNAYGYRVKIDAPPVIPANISDQIKMAIQCRYPVSLTYDDESNEGCTGSRDVKIVCYGKLKNGSKSDAIRVYETAGAHHQPIGGMDSWRLLRIDRLRSIRFMDAWMPWIGLPEGYVKGDSAMQTIYAEL